MNPARRKLHPSKPKRVVLQPEVYKALSIQRLEAGVTLQEHVHAILSKHIKRGDLPDRPNREPAAN